MMASPHNPCLICQLTCFEAGQVFLPKLNLAQGNAKDHTIRSAAANTPHGCLDASLSACHPKDQNEKKATVAKDREQTNEVVVERKPTS